MHVKPLVRVTITSLHDGSVLTREWGVDEPPIAPPEMQPWMIKPLKSWAHPQDPITFTAFYEHKNRAAATRWLEDL